MDTIGTRARQLETSYGSLNNTRRSVNSLLSQDEGGLVISAATIAGVNSTNSFDDSGGGLPVFAAGSLVEVTGLELNSRTWRVVSSDADSLVVEGGVVQDESEGATVVIRSV